MRNREPLRPRVTAIVPSHGHRRFLPARLASITTQSRLPDELVIIDDGSRDGSAAWLRSWSGPLPTQLECRPNASGNPFAVWNAGAARTSGDWLWIAESDDACHPDLLATLLQAAETHPDAAIVFCQSELIDADGTVIGTFADYTKAYDSESWRADFNCDGRTAAARHLLARNTIPNVSACLLSRRAWQAAGGADDSLKLCGDWSTYARLLRHGSLVFLAAPLNQHRRHPDTQRTRVARSEYVRQGYEARRRTADLHAVSDAEREFARRYAWGEAAAYLEVTAAQVPGALDAAAHAAALAFDADFDRRAKEPAARAWDHCDAFFDASGAFAESNQRRLPITHADSWTTLVFHGGTGRVRLDPFARPWQCQLRQLALVDPVSGHNFWTANEATQFAGVSANPGVKLTPREDFLSIECSHDDPQLYLPATAVAGRESFDLVVEIRYPLE